MDDSPASRVLPNSSGISVRSRASSVISCGTATSITTLPQPQSQSQPQEETTGIDVLLGRRNFRITARPGSILSISSFDQPAPPYDNFPHDQSHQQPPTFPSIRDTSTSPPATHSPTQSPHPFSEPQPQFISPTTPATDPDPDPEPDNIITQHYTRVVRTIDANHRAELTRLTQSHTSELSSLRHSIDAAYRRVLQAKDAEVDHIRAETATLTASLSAAHQLAMEDKEKEIEELREQARRREEVLDDERLRAVGKARNEIEDLWEGRWKDRARVVAEEGRRREEEFQRRVQEAVEEQAGKWELECRRRVQQAMDT
ncbi:hypothetical protein MMC24_003809 [Lignoscripta atroalba]|nr:hypothetical protein [Lignoscripta atroalba]